MGLGFRSIGRGEGTNDVAARCVGRVDGEEERLDVREERKESHLLSIYELSIKSLCSLFI